MPTKTKQKTVKGASLDIEIISLECKKCGTPVRVDSKSIEVLCWRCTCLMTYDPEELKEKNNSSSGFIKGWAFMAEFVHKDGRVFHKGKEVEELKDTKEPTNIKKIREQRKKYRAEKKKKEKIKAEKKEKKLIEHAKKAKKARIKKQKEKERLIEKLKG